MKKIVYTLSLAATMMLCFSANLASATELAGKSEPKKEMTLNEEQKAQQVEVIKRRVEEIKSMDKSNLTRQERKALKKELKEMKEQARAITGGGVYLSVGAIIIIILILILIL